MPSHNAQETAQYLSQFVPTRGFQNDEEIIEYIRRFASVNGYHPNYKSLPPEAFTRFYAQVHLDVRISTPEFLSLPPGYLADDICHVLSRFKNPFGKTIKFRIEDDFQGTDDLRFVEDITCCEWFITRIKKVMDKHGEPSYYQVSLSSPQLGENQLDSWNVISGMCCSLKSAYQISDDQDGIPNLRVEVGCAMDYRDGIVLLKQETMSILMSFLFTFERILNDIHAPHVIENSKVVPLAGNCVASWHAERHQLSRKEFLNFIYRCRTTKELLETTFHEDTQVQQSYSINHDLKNSDAISPMVQFNQHEATLDPDRITNWVWLCIAIIEFATIQEGGEFLDFLKSEERPSNLNELLLMLGEPKIAKFYEDKAYDHTDEFYEEALLRFNPHFLGIYPEQDSHV